MNTCLICNTSIKPFMSFGRMPIANGFLNPSQFADEYFFELQVAFCPDCGMMQLAEQVEPEKMFHENYAFFSSTSSRMAIHFKQLADFLMEGNMKTPNPFVVEIGSNDGIMLQHFANAGLRHLGIEPSRNVAEAAKNKGIQTICRFFDEGFAQEILAEHGQVDIFLGSR